MDAGPHEPRGAEPVRLDRVSAARRRLPLLFLGFLSLVFGVGGGLSRLSPLLPGLPGPISLHGALMVSGFLGTLIALERAVALGRLWAYAAPALAGLGGVLIVAGALAPGFVLLAASGAVFVAASVAVLARQPSLETATLLGGAAAWLAGNALLLAGLDPVPWWMAFFALTIGGERLELSRYLKRSAFSRNAFIAVAIAIFAGSLAPRLQGAAFVLLALWLFAYDLARITVRQTKLPRFVAVCLLAGYFWLALSGALAALNVARDAALHAFFVGFVFSMVIGHAPVILPAVLRLPVPYRPVLYLPLALLHASLAARVLGGFFAEGSWLLKGGAWGNAAAIALFIATAAALVARGRFDSSQEAARRSR